MHATHSVPAEIDAVAARGAGVVLCPGTEGNLGDGLADLPGWLAAGVPLAIGSDSQVTRAWPEELRWLEYGQRLGLRRRNVSAAPGVEPSTAAWLFDCVSAGGAAAAGFARWGLQAGARADLLVLDPRDPALRGLPPDHLLDGARLRRAGATLRARDGRRPLARAARRKDRVALRRRDAGPVGARRHANPRRLTRGARSLINGQCGRRQYEDTMIRRAVWQLSVAFVVLAANLSSPVHAQCVQYRRSR